jgi:metallopeptidase MepB
MAVVNYAHDPETRMKMFVGEQNMMPRNVPLFKDIALRRDSQARLQGYASHAAFRMETRVAKTTQWVDEFLARLRDGVVPRAKEELATIQERRIRDMKEKQIYQAGDEEYFPPWDRYYYMRLMKEDLDIDQASISEYFPLEQTAERMLDVFAYFFKLRFDPIPTEDVDPACLWHAGVRVFSVWEDAPDDKSFVGYLYFDLLRRDNKYKGNQNVTIQTVSCPP